MALQKNIAGKVMVFAFDITDNTAKTGDAAQITGNVRIDGGAANAIDDTNPTELEDGYYIFDLTAAETNGDHIGVFPASSTGSIQVIGVPGSIYTDAPNYNLLGIESDGDLTKVNLCANTTLVDTTTVATDAEADIAALNDVAATDIVTSGAITTSAGAVSNVTLVATTTVATDAEADIAALNNVAATDIVSSGAITTLTGAVVNVDLVDLVTTTTTNTDMVGTDDAALATSLATAQLDLDIITDTDGVIIGAAGIDLVWDEVLTGATHNVTNSSGKRLREISATIFNSGTAQTGANNTITLESGASTINDFYDRAKVVTTSGTGAGQEAIITDYAGGTLIATVTPAWTTNPDNTTGYEIVPAQVHSTVRNGGYDNGFVFVDTNNGVSGTQKGVNGTSTNPSDNLTDAYAIAAQEMLTKLFIEPGSALTLPSDSSDLVFEGAAYTVALNGQNIGETSFRGASVSGVGVDTTGGRVPSFTLCGIGSVTLPPCNGFQCGFFGTFTIGTAGNFTFGGSADVFNLKLTIDYGAALNASQFFLPSWGGGEVEIQNAGAGTGTYILDMHGFGALTINANCSATTTVEVHGHIAITNNASGITVIDDTNICAVADLGNGQNIGNNLNDMAGATFVTGTDSLEAISDNALVASDILTTALTESYAADGATFTLAQALYMLHSSISEFAIVGTVLTAKKLDGSATAMTFTLDDASDPTSRTRAT